MSSNSPILILDSNSPEAITALRNILKDVVKLCLEELREENEKQKDEIITTPEVLESLNISRGTLTNYHKKGLPYVKSSPNRYFKRDIENFMQSDRIINKP